MSEHVPDNYRLITGLLTERDATIIRLQAENKALGHMSRVRLERLTKAETDLAAAREELEEAYENCRYNLNEGDKAREQVRALTEAIVRWYRAGRVNRATIEAVAEYDDAVDQLEALALAAVEEKEGT